MQLLRLGLSVACLTSALALAPTYHIFSPQSCVEPHINPLPSTTPHPPVSTARLHAVLPGSSPTSSHCQGCRGAEEKGARVKATKYRCVFCALHKAVGARSGQALSSDCNLLSGSSSSAGRSYGGGDLSQRVSRGSCWKLFLSERGAAFSDLHQGS